VEDADLTGVAGVVPDGHLLTDIAGQDGVEVAQALEMDAVGVDLAGSGHGQ
jgi:hypothetical protein